MVKKNLLFLFVTIAIGVLIYFTMPPLESAATKAIDDEARLSISIVIETNKFLISIAFVIVGVLGGSVIGKTTINMENSGFRFTLFFLSILCAIVSLVYGYLLYDETLLIFSNSVADINADIIQFCRRRQFLFLVLSAICFAWYLFNYYFYQIKSKKQDETFLFIDD